MSLFPSHKSGGSSPRSGINLFFKVMKCYVKTDVQKTDVEVFKITTLRLVRQFGLDGIRFLSKPGAIMHPFEPQFSLQGAFHGKLALSVCSNGAFEETEKADCLIGGEGSWWYKVRIVEISHHPFTTIQSHINNDSVTKTTRTMAEQQQAQNDATCILDIGEVSDVEVTAVGKKEMRMEKKKTFTAANTTAETTTTMDKMNSFTRRQQAQHEAARKFALGVLSDVEVTGVLLNDKMNNFEVPILVIKRKKTVGSNKKTCDI